MAAKTYTRADLRALLNMTVEDGESLGGECNAVRYPFREDGLWLAFNPQLTARELEAIAGLNDPEPKHGVPGLYGRSEQRPMLPFPFTASQLLALDDESAGVLYERIERGDDTREWIDELASSNPDAAELARYLLGWESVSDEANVDAQTGCPDQQSQQTARRIRRVNALSPVVERAVRECGSDQAAQVFALMQQWARQKNPPAPLRGVTETGIQWINAKDEPKELSLAALRERLRNRRTQASTG